MTESSRRQHIVQALNAYEASSGLKDTYRAPWRGRTTLPVIEVPLDLPLLNVDSFRIAPQLEDHPQGEWARAHPDDPAAQQIVAELIREVHRNVEELKENLLDEGQAQPGVITRDGKLINANTRCVLLRELAREGKGRISTLQVAVLPGDATNQEILELEMVLQQQLELKDEYRLISELVMIKKLHDAGLTDEAIAKRRRFRRSGTTTAGQKVKDRRAVLVLMERARRLVGPPVPLTAFDSDTDQLQNWLELLGQVRQLDAQLGSEAGDEHIRRWLIAFFSGVSSVHRLRHATGRWVERSVLDDLRRDADLSSLVDGPPSATKRSQAESPAPPGLDVLGSDGGLAAGAASAMALRPLLDAVAVARRSDDDATVELPDGIELPAKAVLSTVKGSVERALDEEKRRNAAGTAMDRPHAELLRARTALNAALDALAEVGDDPGFASRREAVRTLAAEVRRLADRVGKTISAATET